MIYGCCFEVVHPTAHLRWNVRTSQASKHIQKLRTGIFANELGWLSKMENGSM